MPENNKERFINKEEVQEYKFNNPENSKNDKSNKKVKLIIIISIVVVIIIAIIAVVFFKNSEDISTNHEIIPPENINENTNNSSDSNINITNTPATNLSVNEEINLTGRVFIKAYGSPSESYGILSTDGNEIGFGSYDSMREQFRPYVNENVNVIFSNVCKSTSEGCCKSVFFYCGTVSSWEPVEESN